MTDEPEKTDEHADIKQRENAIEALRVSDLPPTARHLVLAITQYRKAGLWINPSRPIAIISTLPNQI